MNPGIIKKSGKKIHTQKYPHIIHYIWFEIMLFHFS